MLVILQAIPEEVSMESVKERLKNMQEVMNIHDCHIWSMDGQYNILTIHLQLNKDYKLSEQSELKQKIRSALKDASINHVTIEFEGKDENCEMKGC